MRTESVPMEELAKVLEIQLERGTAPLRVTGISMYPMLRHNRDTVQLRAVSSALRKGDVILFRRDDGSYILHRIVAVRKDGLLCAGDNQYMAESVNPSQAIAVVDGFRRGEKWYACSAPGCRLYTWVWTGLFPVRRPILAIRRTLGRLRKHLTKRKTK